jgi:hypothetical protein
MRRLLRVKFGRNRFVPLARDEHDPFARAPKGAKQSPHLVDFAENDIAIPKVRTFVRRVVRPKDVVASSDIRVIADGFRDRQRGKAGFFRTQSRSKKSDG